MSTPFLQEVVALPIGLAVNMGRLGEPEEGIGYTTIDKFGENPALIAGEVKQDIWEGGGLYTWSDTSDIDSVSSSDVDDIGQCIKVTGILDPEDTNGQTVGYAILNGQNTVSIYSNPDGLTGDVLSFWRVYRMENEADDGGDLEGMVYCFVNGATTGGVPDDPALIRAIINNGNNQTLMAIYTIPPGHVGSLFRDEVGMSRAQTTGNIQAAYYSRRYGKVFKIKKRVDVVNTGSSLYQDYRSFPDIIPALTDIRISAENVTANNSGAFATFDILLADERLHDKSWLKAIGQPGY
jgi:hypothetical protein